MKRFHLQTGSRLALCLIDLSGSKGRIDGSVGVALNEPGLEICVEEADSELVIDGAGPSTARVRSMVEELSVALGCPPSARIRVERSYPAHAGLGSSTQLLLAVAAGFAALHGVSVSVRDLALLVRRGGTSSAGVAAFEHGGIVVDGGHSFGIGKEKETFLPSSATSAPPGPLLARHDVPGDWRIICAIANGVSGLSGPAEIDFFQQNCPVDDSEVAETCRLILMQLLPGFVLGDLGLVADAVESMQHLAFKQRVWDAQPESVGALKEYFAALGLRGVGLSSLGPTLFTFVEQKDAESVLTTAQRDLNRRGLSVTLWHTSGRNSGAVIQAQP